MKVILKQFFLQILNMSSCTGWPVIYGRVVLVNCKADLHYYSVHYCTAACTSVTIYSEQHGHDYLVGLYCSKISYNFQREKNKILYEGRRIQISKLVQFKTNCEKQFCLWFFMSLRLNHFIKKLYIHEDNCIVEGLLKRWKCKGIQSYFIFMYFLTLY